MNKLAANSLNTKFGQVTDQNWQVNSSTIDEYQYAYDYNGNREYRKNSDTSGLDEAYTYDDLDRVTDLQRGTLSGTTITGTPAREEQFTLDELGNWPGYLTKTSGTTDLTQTRTHSNVNETTGITGGSWVTPQYDNGNTGNGNMTQGPKPGSETTTLNFVYDAWNRMVTLEDGSSNILAKYTYNGLNQRVSKREPDGVGGYNNGNDYYYNENWQVLEETETIPNGGGHTLTYAQYIWDTRYIDAPILRFRNTELNVNGTEDETMYYTTDANMNVTALVNSVGGMTTVVERYTYDTYGKVHIWASNWTTSRSSSSYDNQILFGGYRYDPESGLYHVRNRMYHPTLGRWMQRDAKPHHHDRNAYLYADDAPARYNDPMGLCTPGDKFNPRAEYHMLPTMTDQTQDHAQDDMIPLIGDTETMGKLMAFIDTGGAGTAAVLTKGSEEAVEDLLAKGTDLGLDYFKGLSTPDLQDLVKSVKAATQRSAMETEGVSVWVRVAYDECEERCFASRWTIGWIKGDTYTVTKYTEWTEALDANGEDWYGSEKDAWAAAADLGAQAVEDWTESLGK